MPEKRRKFSPQFRAEAVQMVIETGRPVAEVARDLGVKPLPEAVADLDALRIHHRDPVGGVTGEYTPAA